MTNKLTSVVFLKKAKLVHGDRYSYDSVNMKGACINISIRCPIHGYFEQQPRMHLSGQGCPTCGRKSAGLAKSLKFEEFIKRADTIYNGKYFYIKDTFANSSMQMTIICPLHDKFNQSPKDHLSGRSCPKCGLLSRASKRTADTHDYIKRASIVHNNRYSYDNTIYIKNNYKIEIFCKEHGSFWQIAADHINGSGCPKCCSAGSSKGEKEWLDFMNIPIKFRLQKIIIGDHFYKPDAVDIKNKIIYEYNGDYWHGNLNKYDPLAINSVNKDTFMELYLKTLIKRNTFRDAGFIVISIWESEWKQYKDNI